MNFWKKSPPSIIESHRLKQIRRMDWQRPCEEKKRLEELDSGCAPTVRASLEERLLNIVAEKIYSSCDIRINHFRGTNTRNPPAILRSQLWISCELEIYLTSPKAWQGKFCGYHARALYQTTIKRFLGETRNQSWLTSSKESFLFDIYEQ